MSDFITGLGLVLVIEGLLWALAPRLAFKLLLKASEMPEASLRMAGALAVTAGVAIVWLARG